jgi:hypothetical protein
MSEDTEVEELVFRRFPANKQEQVRQLVAYATLMGLSGKDLVSIGGKLDRIQFRRECTTNRAIIESMELDTVGKDTDFRQRWSYKSNGVRYYFDEADWHYVRIRSIATKKTMVVPLREEYHFGPRNWRYRGSFWVGNVMLNVYHGHIQLNF